MINRHLLSFAFVGAGVLSAAGSVTAQSPTAVVEEVNGNVAGVEFMDYVAPGTKIELGSKGSIVLGYMKSCSHEIIFGGTVTVGTEESKVENGSVDRTIVACETKNIQVSSEKTYETAGAVFRDAFPVPPVTLFGQSPLVQTNGAGRLVIKRLDQPNEIYEISVSQSVLERGRFYDFAKTDKTLTTGATYVVSFGKRKIVFKIDSRAKPGLTPIIGRLLRFEGYR